jgi:hypothetical protein
MTEARHIDPQQHYLDPNGPENRAQAEGRPVDDRPSEVSDPVDPPSSDPAPVTAKAPPAPPKDDEEPPLFRDPRDEIARRARERRAQEEGTRPGILNIDEASIPEGVPIEGQEPAAPPAQPQAAAPQDGPITPPAPPQQRQQAQDGSYKLTVNGSTFNVSKDQLLMYAELDEHDARDVPEPALVKIAQKNLAAEQALQAAKEAKRLARQAAPATEGEHHAPDQQSQPDADTRQRKLQLMETVQIGDPEAALQAKRELDDLEWNERQAQTRLNDAVANAGRQIDEAWKSANLADITGDEVKTSAFAGLLPRKLADEVRRVAPEHITDEVYQVLLNEPQRAVAAYQGALAEGRAVRKPAEMIESIASTVRGRFTQPVSTPQPTTTRVEEKQRLMQQPTRTEYEQPRSQDAQRVNGRDPSAVIAGMRRARHQPSGY